MLDRVPPPPLNSTSSLTVLNLTVESTSSFIGAVTMGAGATVASNLGVTGAVTITGVLTAQSSLAVSSATTLTGPVSLGGALSAVSGLSSLAGLNASATAVVSLTVSSAVTFSGLTKVLDQGDFIIQNQADTTKQLEFNLSGQTTGKLLTISSLLTTTQIIQIPNITATDTLATLGLAQTFSAVNTFSNSQDATALGTGALVLSAGGLSVNNQIRLGGALTGSGTITGTQLVSTIATGTAPFTVTSTTVVPNLNVSQLLGQTWANPGAIGGTTPATTFALSGILTSTNTTSATSSTAGAVVIGNGTAATSVAFGAGNAQIGAALTVGTTITTTNGNITANATSGSSSITANGAAGNTAQLNLNIAGVVKVQIGTNSGSALFAYDNPNGWNVFSYTAGAIGAGVFAFNGTLDATNSTTAGLKTAGGFATAKAAVIGTTLTVVGATTLAGGATLCSTTASLTNNAGAVTLTPPTNAPTGTTKWVYVAINNNGTTIYALCASP